MGCSGFARLPGNYTLLLCAFVVVVLGIPTATVAVIQGPSAFIGYGMALLLAGAGVLSNARTSITHDEAGLHLEQVAPDKRIVHLPTDRLQRAQEVRIEVVSQGFGAHDLVLIEDGTELELILGFYTRATAEYVRSVVQTMVDDIRPGRREIQ